jgi:hypothetical protein
MASMACGCGMSRWASDRNLRLFDAMAVAKIVT